MGGICTTRISGPLFSPPEIQDALPTNIVPDTPDPLVDPPDGFVSGDDSLPGCRVFSPGRYDLLPDLSGAADVYFKAGDYHFNFDDEWSILGDNVWAGYPDTGSIGSLGPCNAAATADYDAGLSWRSRRSDLLHRRRKPHLGRQRSVARRIPSPGCRATTPSASTPSTRQCRSTIPATAISRCCGRWMGSQASRCTA